ncbi:MAG TPA: hypothetical protein VM943_03965 [Pyrinomonadaceae bacterium]|nr:hypothetical protein [Pyrinomonadaceae bacterium]
MIYSPNTRRRMSRSGEQGGSRLSFLITLLIIAVASYVAYQYVPVAYHASILKDSMQHAVDVGAATGKSTDWVRARLRSEADDHGAPPDALINVQQRDGRIEAHMRWTRSVPLPGYLYQHNFDHTVKSSSYLSTQ